jgi:hypothetical protein
MKRNQERRAKSKEGQEEEGRGKRDRGIVPLSFFRLLPCALCPMYYTHYEMWEDLIRRAGEKGIDTGEAEAWLDELRSIMPRIPDDIADIELESPLLVAISSKFTGADYDRMRWHTARQIVNLQKALGD